MVSSLGFWYFPILSNLAGIHDKFNLMSYIQRIEEIPIPDHFRKSTDRCCTVWAFIFSTTLLIYAIVGISKDNLVKTNFPTDGRGQLCGIDHPSQPYLYFASPQDRTQRSCVANCPTQKSPIVQCSGLAVCGKPTQYDSEEAKTRYGMYCVPTNPEIRQKFMENTGLDTRKAFANSLLGIIMSLGLAAVLGLLYLLITQLAPSTTHTWTIILAGISLIASGVLLLRKQTDRYLIAKNIVAVISILVGIVFLPAMYFFKSQLRISSIFLAQSSRFFCANLYLMFYIPLFLILAGLLLLLNIFQLLAFWSIPTPHFDANKVFYSISGAGYVYMSVLVGIQLYWGLSFLKEFFNFIVSGSAIEWYFGRKASCCAMVFRALRYHVGSIIGGSILVGILNIPDFLVDLIKPKGLYEAYGTCYSALCGWLDNIFTLVRSDAMAYINISALPFCNSARYCQFLCSNSKLFSGSESPIRFYRFTAHALLLSLILNFILVFFPNAALPTIVFALLACFFVITYFIGIHADAAEALMITFVTEQYLQGGNYAQVTFAPKHLMQEISTTMMS